MDCIPPEVKQSWIVSKDYQKDKEKILSLKTVTGKEYSKAFEREYMYAQALDYISNIAVDQGYELEAKQNEIDNLNEVIDHIKEESNTSDNVIDEIRSRRKNVIVCNDTVNRTNKLKEIIMQNEAKCKALQNK